MTSIPSLLKTSSKVALNLAVADCPVVAEKPGNAGGAKGAGHPGLVEGQLQVQEELTGKPKPFAISKQIVWEAHRRVKVNKGAAGVDGESIAEFEGDWRPERAVDYETYALARDE